MPMIYADSIQPETRRYKMRATLAAIVESMCDNDEALDRREPEALEPRDVWEELGSPRVGEDNWSAWQDARDNSLGNQLSALARAAGTVDACLGEDSRVYIC